MRFLTEVKSTRQAPEVASLSISTAKSGGSFALSQAARKIMNIKGGEKIAIGEHNGNVFLTLGEPGVPVSAKGQFSHAPSAKYLLEEHPGKTNFWAVNEAKQVQIDGTSYTVYQLLPQPYKTPRVINRSTTTENTEEVAAEAQDSTQLESAWNG